jgi:hypothetical protein
MKSLLIAATATATLLDPTLLTRPQRKLIRLLRGDGLNKTTIAELLRPESVLSLQTVLLQQLPAPTD